ncbi:polysaccharide biosynthesis tyrosine autokinase [Klugiella xanthotipulae]|uniref:non-specific protein-tyrosine kinase n=1 Tax=Klugiella xanthotipulae TaxID=244735 RepID=A0A543HYC9_9MICO|nr:polysaccharide biosynthesis tyrosine autokinase [Klugiella xanthotipulae]TQM63319.1 capsular exopolysaccharide synthesis family protein [Klugiella xanthotipulae]
MTLSDTSPSQQEASHADSFDLRGYIRILQNYWLGGVCVIVTCVLLTAAWTALQTPVYQTRATTLVQALGADNLNLAFAGETLTKSRAESYAQMAMSESIAESVISDLNLDATPGEVLAQIKSTLLVDTAVIEVTASGGTPEEAQSLANAWVTALIAQVKTLESPDGQDSQVVELTSLSVAPLPAAPTSPNIKTNLAIGFAVGLLAAVLYAFIRNVFDRRIRSVDSVERDFGVSVVGVLPIDPKIGSRNRILAEASGTAAFRKERFAVSEALRSMRTNLSYVHVDEPPRILVVTSAMPGEGKSTVSANLASAMASTGQAVVLIDCDLRRPTQEKVFGLAAGAGLTDVLSGRAEFADVVHSLGKRGNLSVVTAGRVPPNPSELLGSKRMTDLIQRLSEIAFVVLDAPPLLPVTDAAILSKAADGAVIVAQARRTTHDQLGRAINSIRRIGGTVTGVVLNRVPSGGTSSSEYGYYGTTYYGQDDDASASRRPTKGKPTKGKSAKSSRSGSRARSGRQDGDAPKYRRGNVA